MGDEIASPDAKLTFCRQLADEGGDPVAVDPLERPAADAVLRQPRLGICLDDAIDVDLLRYRDFSFCRLPGVIASFAPSSAPLVSDSAPFSPRSWMFAPLVSERSSRLTASANRR